MPSTESDAAAYATTSETDFYEILSIPLDSTSDAALRKAYRKQSLKWHPDKNPSEEAKEKFYLLSIAYDVLSDPVTKAAYDNARNARLAKKRRSEAFDLHRRKMQEDLESRENAAKRTKVDGEDAEARFRAQLNKLQEEGARLRHMREEAIRKAAKEEMESSDGGGSEKEEKRQVKSAVSRFSELDRTVRIRWRRKGGEKIDSVALRKLFERFGKIEDCVVPVEKAGKEKKLRTGLLVFQSIVGAHTAVHDALSTKCEEFKLFKDVLWAGGKEPDISHERSFSPPPPPPPSHQSQPQASTPMSPDFGGSANSPAPKSTSWVPPTSATSTPKGKGIRRVPSFASFSSVAGVSTPNSSPYGKGAVAQSPDYESITLMRMRAAEKSRLENEIRRKEQEGEAEAAPSTGL